MRKTIYIKDKKIWDEVQSEAKKMDRSISWYLISCHQERMEIKQGVKAADSKSYFNPQLKKTK